MEAVTKKIFLSADVSNVITAILIALVAGFVGYYFWVNSQYIQEYKTVENFAGPAKGSGVPDCVRTSSEAGYLADFFLQRSSSTDTGEDDLREFLTLLGKLSCFKKDLLSVSGLVDATRSQKYTTAHDIEPVAETAARCFTKTIPPRDLDLSFDKWSSRGMTLLKRLCTSYNTSNGDIKKLENTFGALITDVKDVAKGVCFSGSPILGGAKEVRKMDGYEPHQLVDLGTYNGYY